MKQLLPHTKKENGLTLVEVVVVILIISIVFASGAKFFQLAYSTYILQRNAFDLESQGTLSMQVIKSDIQTIRSTSAISTATTTALSFTNIYGTSVSYQVSNSQLLKNGQPLSDHVQSISFRYYNQSGVELTTPIPLSSIRYITCTLVLSNASTLTFTTGAPLWNIM